MDRIVHSVVQESEAAYFRLRWRRHWRRSSWMDASQCDLDWDWKRFTGDGEWTERCSFLSPLIWLRGIWTGPCLRLFIPFARPRLDCGLRVILSRRGAARTFQFHMGLSWAGLRMWNTVHYLFAIAPPAAALYTLFYLEKHKSYTTHCTMYDSISMLLVITYHQNSLHIFASCLRWKRKW